MIATTYTLDQLDDGTQREVLERYSDYMEDSRWADGIVDYWRDKLEEQGYHDPEIAWSGYWSHKDGASFTGHVDIREWIASHGSDREYPDVLHWIGEGYVDKRANIKRSLSAYRDSLSVYLGDMWFYGTQSVECLAQCKRLHAQITEDIRDLSLSICADLRQELAHITSEEQLREMIATQQYRFDIDGNTVA